MNPVIRYGPNHRGEQYFIPLYAVSQPVEISVSGISHWPYVPKGHHRRTSDMQIYFHKSPIIKTKIIELENLTPREKHDDPEIYNVREEGKFKARFVLKPTKKFDKSDLSLDRHVGKTVRKKAKQLVQGSNNKYELARKIYDYIYGIQYDDDPKGTSLLNKPPALVIKSNKANHCACKAELFQDLCRVLRIPARVQLAYHCTDKEVERYLQTGRRPSLVYHAFVAFFDGGWHLADATLGGFNDEFKLGNYYEELFNVRRIDSFRFKVREL